jgi:uncharacterized protein (DUF1330 family)
MKPHYTIALAMFAGVGLGAAAVQGLHAQAKPPVYSIAEIDIADQAAYSTYVPKAQAAIRTSGGKFLAAGGTITAVEGEPPKSRVVLQQWDSLEKYQAYRNSAAFKADAREGSEMAHLCRRRCTPVAKRLPGRGARPALIGKNQPRV